MWYCSQPLLPYWCILHSYWSILVHSDCCDDRKAWCSFHMGYFAAFSISLIHIQYFSDHSSSSCYERGSPAASPEDVPPSKSKALCILQQCCTPKKSRSSSTIWTKYNAAVKQRECIIPDLWEYYCRTAGPSYNISQLKLFYVRNMKRLMAA